MICFYILLFLNLWLGDRFVESEFYRRNQRPWKPWRIESLSGEKIVHARCRKCKPVSPIPGELFFPVDIIWPSERGSNVSFVSGFRRSSLSSYFNPGLRWDDKKGKKEKRGAQDAEKEGSEDVTGQNGESLGNIAWKAVERTTLVHFKVFMLGL